MTDTPDDTTPDVVDYDDADANSGRQGVNSDSFFTIDTDDGTETLAAALSQVPLDSQDGGAIARDPAFNLACRWSENAGPLSCRSGVESAASSVLFSDRTRTTITGGDRTQLRGGPVPRAS